MNKVLHQPHLGVQLKRSRHEMGWGLNEASKRIGISKGNLSKIEHGNDLCLSTLNWILEAYHLKLDIVKA